MGIIGLPRRLSPADSARGRATQGERKVTKTADGPPGVERRRVGDVDPAPPRQQLAAAATQLRGDGGRSP